MLLPSEFQTELGALIRSLAQQVDAEPSLQTSSPKEHIERAIVALVSIYLSLPD